MAELSKRTRRFLTFGFALIGTILFYSLDLPLPFLFGPMLACLVAALFKFPVMGMGPVSKAARTILGVAVGASVTPELVHKIPAMVSSVMLVPLYILIIGFIGVPFFRKVFGFDRVTSYFAAMPGGLQDMVLFGQEAGGDVRALSLIHATRVFMIVSLAPLVLVNGFHVTLDAPVGAPVSDLPVVELLLMAAAAIIGWKGAERIGLFGAAILGPLIVATILSLMGLIHNRPPKEAILFAQFFIGIGIGIGYLGVTLSELKRVVFSGVVYVVLLAILAAIFTEFVVYMGFARPVEGFLSFAPGGQAEMTVLAIVCGADLGFVVVHHLTRIIVVITGAPIFARFVKVERKE